MGVVEPHQKINKCRLSTACRTHNGDTLAGLDGEVEVIDQGLVRGVGELQVLDLQTALGLFRLPGMHRLRGPGRGFDELQHPSGTGQGVLQLGDHTGNLVKGLGILVGVVQQNRQAANTNAAAEAEERTGQSYQRINHGIYKPGAGICQG